MTLCYHFIFLLSRFFEWEKCSRTRRKKCSINITKQKKRNKRRSSLLRSSLLQKSIFFLLVIIRFLKFIYIKIFAWYNLDKDRVKWLLALQIRNDNITYFSKKEIVIVIIQLLYLALFTIIIIIYRLIHYFISYLIIKWMN